MLSPSDIISKHPWRAALFLTYPLSLSFYEAQLHKEGLHRRGCRDIRIVCDPDGHGMCLSERRSSRVGAEYRVSVAALPRGVFHPKVVLLEGESESVLMVGSGNLTFGGFGRNVEVLDILHSARHPHAFAAFRTFLSDLAGRPDLILCDRGWVDEWTTRLARFEGSTPSPDPLILHNALAPLGAQLSELAAAHGGAEVVRSLAPFHDPDGAALIRFADMCGAGSLVVGTLATEDAARANSSPFPFHAHATTSLRLEAATVRAPSGGTRPLHAKWLDIACRDGTTLVVTGSLNATTQSMHTTHNIELVTVRTLPAGTPPPLDWTPCPAPGIHDRPDYRHAGLGERIVVHAVLGHDARITGRMLAGSSVAGRWDVVLDHPSGQIFAGSVEADQTGAFSFPIPDTSVFMSRLGVQIELSRDTRTAKGWLEIGPLLSLNRRGLLSVSTMGRLLSGHAEHDEVAELVAYLATHAEDHLSAFSELDPARHHERKRRDPGSGDDPADADRSVPVSSLFLRDTLGHDIEGNGTGGAEARFLDHILASIRHRLLAPAKAEDDSTDSLPDAPEDEEDKKETERSAKRVEASRKLFNERMEDLVARLAEAIPRKGRKESSEAATARHAAAARLGAACALWLEGNLYSLASLPDAWNALGPLARRWFAIVTSKLKAASAGSACTSHVQDLGLVFAFRAWRGGASLDRWQLSLIHSSLERFLGRDGTSVGPLLAKAATGDEPSLFFDRLLPPAARRHLPECLSILAGTPTIGAQIRLLTAGDPEARALAADDDSLPLWSRSLAAPLRQIVRSGHKAPVVEARTTDTHCPACQMALPRANVSELRHGNITRCPHFRCGNFLVSSSPSD